MSKPAILVAGLGKTGFSIARYLQRKQKAFVVFDTRETPPDLEQFKEEFPGVSVYLKDMPLDVYEGVETIIASPGVPLDSGFFETAIAKNIRIYGDIECFARETKTPVIAITGTNGKSTVTTLVGEIVRAAGFKVGVAGNIGTPVLDLMAEDNQYDFWVLELSSFQLELTHTISALAAAVLNVSADHLDRHHTIEAYAAAKHRIYHRSQFAIYNRDDALTIPDLHYGIVQTPQKITFGTDEPQEGQWGLRKENDTLYLAQGMEKLCAVDELKLKGVHNWQNALCAAALSTAAGMPKAAIVKVLTEFSGLPHRTQWVRTLNQVQWIDDSKGTNIGATISAIKGIGSTLKGKIVLIAGGQGKGADFKELRPAVETNVSAVIVFGQDADKIITALNDSTQVMKVKDLNEAVITAKELAKPGDVVLLSPACASLDMFRDYNHRGEVFAELVQGLPS